MRGTTKLPPTTLPPFDLAAPAKKNFFFRQEFHRHHFHRPPSASVVGLLAALPSEPSSGRASAWHASQQCLLSELLAALTVRL